MLVTLDINDAVYSLLKEKADSDGFTVEKEIEQVIKNQIDHKIDKQDDRFLKWLMDESKNISSGKKDGAENHDHYLYGKRE